MPNKRNIELLEKIKGKVEKASAMFFVDYQGLTHKQLEEARNGLKEINSELYIVKNTLMSLAFKEKKHLDISNTLKGPFATLFSYEDPIKTAKALYIFFKKYISPAYSGLSPSGSKTGGPKIKFGLFENAIIDGEKIIELANLPTREVLLSKLVGVLSSPMRNLVYDLNWNMQRFVLTLRAIEKNKA